MYRIFITILTFMWCCAFSQAQHHIVYSDDIRSVQVVAGNRWQELPIITANSGERVNISFDQLSHEYHRYTYSVVHLDKDWQETEGLIASDFVSGFQSGLTIDDSEESINTTQDYTHYRLHLPNSQCRLTMSGNYRVDVIDEDNDGEKVLSAFFLVNEGIVNVGTTYSGDTDIDVRRNHQQVSVKADYSKLKATNPLEQVTTYVMQNYTWDSLVRLGRPTGFNQQYMEWTHCRDLIFEGGNEYHKFEILDVHRNSFNVEENTWDADNETWHTHLWADYRRASYVYDETPKGAFLIRNSDNSESNTTSEYVTVHFTLQAEPSSARLRTSLEEPSSARLRTSLEEPSSARLRTSFEEQPFPYPVYVDGMWTQGHLTDKYRMTYDAARKAYTCAVPLKYGYYSYRYVMLKPDGSTAIPPTEGSFYETRNTYTALVYYRGTLDRADRLVGVTK